MLENWLCYCILPLTAGFVLDLILGDPRRIVHPVVLMGKMISGLERILLFREQAKEAEKKVIKGKKRNFIAGCITAAVVAAVSTAVPAALVWICADFHPALGMAVSCVLCWQMLAAKSLKRESMKVYDAFRRGDTEGARYAVSMIVGRDVSALGEEGIVRAAVETVAENTSDGVIAPMFYMALGGPAGAWLYKSVNTMDSMIGYRNERYEWFGKCAARADDVLNFIPARISGTADDRRSRTGGDGCGGCLPHFLPGQKETCESQLGPDRIGLRRRSGNPAGRTGCLFRRPS